MAFYEVGRGCFASCPRPRDREKRKRQRNAERKKAEGEEKGRGCPPLQDAPEKDEMKQRLK